MNNSILTDSDILETVNESVNNNIVATIVMSTIVLIIFIIVCGEYLRNSEVGVGQGCTDDSANRKKTVIEMVCVFLFIVGAPILFQWNSYKKIFER